MSKELIRKFLLSVKENKAQDAKKYLTEAIKLKIEKAKQEAQQIVEGKRTRTRTRARVRVKKQSGKMTKPTINKPKLLKFSKKIKENIEGERVKFTVKAENGKVPVDIHLEHFTDYLKDKGIDIRFNEDTKDYCVPNEQWDETVTLLKQRQYEPIKKETVNTEVPSNNTEEVNMEDMDMDDVEMDGDLEDTDTEEEDGGDVYLSDDRKDKLRQNISDIRSKLNV